MTGLPDKVIINVTQRDIDRGIKSDCAKCPVALAAARVLGKYATPHAEGLETVTVDGCDIGVSLATRPPPPWSSFPAWAWYKLPQEASLFISGFDFGKPVKPFRFTAHLTGETP
jgi:hypothetical protein